MPKKISKQSNKVIKKKGVTIDDLALMVKRGFDGQNQGFDKVEKRLDSHDLRFDMIDKRFDKVEKRLDDHDKKFISIETNLSILREDFSEMKDIVNSIYNRLDKLIAMFEKTEQENIIIKARLLKIEKVLKERFQIDINAIN